MYTTNTSVKISGLLAFSQYMVKVFANGGPMKTVIIATTMSGKHHNSIFTYVTSLTYNHFCLHKM